MNLTVTTLNPVLVYSNPDIKDVSECALRVKFSKRTFRYVAHNLELSFRCPKSACPLYSFQQRAHYNIRCISSFICVFLRPGDWKHSQFKKQFKLQIV